jgi:hypothetical protein
MVLLDVSGKFDDLGPDLANHINAPPHEREAPRARVAIAKERMDQLNRELVPTVKEALARLGARPYDGDDGTPAPTVLDDRFSDRWFILHVRVAEFNAVGGRDGGLVVRVRLESRFRQERFDNEVASAVPVATDAPTQHAALLTTLLDSIASSRAQLRATLARPRHKWTLAFALAGLDEEQRRDALSLIARCVLDGRGVTPPVASGDRFTVEDRSPRGDEAELRAFAQAIGFDVGPHGKHRCSTWRTKLAGQRAQATLEGTTITVRFIQ